MTSRDFSNDSTLGETLRKRGITRRSFLKFCATTASMMALPPMVPLTPTVIMSAVRYCSSLPPVLRVAIPATVLAITVPVSPPFAVEPLRRCTVTASPVLLVIRFSYWSRASTTKLVQLASDATVATGGVVKVK